MNNKNLMIGVPAYDGKVYGDWLHLYSQTVLDALKENIGIHLEIISGNALISNARNKLIKSFIEDDHCGYLLFIDSDIIWKVEYVFKLLKHVEEFDFVGGLYCKKKDPASFFIDLDLKEGNVINYTDTGLLEAKNMPAGFMMISKDVVLKMIDYYKDSEYITKEENPEILYGLFEDKVIDGRFYGEDIIFCKKWKEMGGRMWIDPKIDLIHVGIKHYNYTFTDFVGLKDGYIKKR